ncbi:type II toxin-antitoxin system HicA family toxin [candidate division KSB1 bacterium]|nr:type II toxin-antitoxin system HicA family toxin [candidate division KSB1 bacterium]NIR69867.1 type II toxin-antitoxin system HicA family toxin [candidate division KSB1 bacterium]NIS22986.1 type II toxin-antitoxin system HicA family toxin [candidate division KSB1 bacterium]NIT69844.1 type II toxin-antitoxin system HicA family toxin [candidate division KSB1 bacterium]NIU25766.1 type II toxin-antitoxin system HicA family toxin [candidate division KSB1 bacterium]
MSPKLKLCSGKETVKKLQKVGWKIKRQKGSHVMLVKEGYRYTLSVPQHKQLGIGILTKLIKQAKLSVEEFNDL